MTTNMHNRGRVRRLAALSEGLKVCSLVWASGVRAYPATTGFDRRRRLRFICRTIIYWKPTIAWLRVCSSPESASLIRRFPRTIERVHRPFVHVGLSSEERLRVSVEHSRFADTLLRKIALELAANAKFRVAEFSVNNERWYVVLELLDRFGKEGDWTLSIRDSRGSRLVSCTFSIAHLAGKVYRPRLLIGGVQGPARSVAGKHVFRALTRKWFGLRPKNLVVYLAQSLARAIGAHDVLMVSNRSHVYSSWRYRKMKMKRIAADYCALSRECGASKSWNGWHLLGVSRNVVSKNRERAGTGETRRDRRELLKHSLDLQIRCAVRR